MGFLVNGLKNRSGQDARVHKESRKALQAVSCSLSLLPGCRLGHRAVAHLLGLNLMMSLEFFGSQCGGKKTF